MFLTANNFTLVPYDLPASTMPNSFQAYVDEKEKEALIKVLGRELYLEFVEGLEEDYPDDKWIDLRDGADYLYCEKQYHWYGVRDMLKPYVVSNYDRDFYDNRSKNGLVMAKVENSKNISPALRISREWVNFYKHVGNDCEQQDNLYGFLTANKDVYPSWRFCDPGKMNSFGL